MKPAQQEKGESRSASIMLGGPFAMTQPLIMLMLECYVRMLVASLKQVNY